MKQTTNKKVGEGKYGHYGHPTAVIRRLLPFCPRALRLAHKTQSSEAFAESWLRSLCSRVAIVGGKKVLRGLKRVGVAGFVFMAIFTAVWAVMPVGAAEAMFGRNFRI